MENKGGEAETNENQSDENLCSLFLCLSSHVLLMQQSALIHGMHGKQYVSTRHTLQICFSSLGFQFVMRSKVFKDNFVVYKCVE